MSLLQLQDPTIGTTINATLGSLSIPYTDVAGNSCAMTLAGGHFNIASSAPSVAYSGDLIVGTPSSGGIIQVNDFQHSVGIGTYPTASNQLAINKNTSITGSLTVAAPAAAGETSASIHLNTNNASAQYYQLYASNGGGGGLTDGHLQLYSYNNSSNWVSEVFDIAPQTAATNYATVTVNAPVFCNYPVSAPLPAAQLIVANAGQSFSIGSSSFNQMLCYQVPSTGATVALPATAGLPVGTFVTVFVSPTSSGAMAIQGAFSAGESLGAGQSATYTVIQGNQGANMATWMRTQHSV